jgi:hypothetical protein
VKYAYPQNPTHAVSAIKRYDESSDSSTSQANLERQQDIAVVGETVPLIYCDRKDWGGELGVNGGVWISPRLIQLGIETTSLSMMYLLSQGKVTGLSIDNTYWGYNKLRQVDPNAEMCFAYEQVPACLDLDYEPGGSLSWTTTQTTGGPNLSGNGTYTFNTASNVIKLAITFTSNISVQGSGSLIGGYGGSTQMIRYNDSLDSYPDPYSGPVTTDSNYPNGNVYLFNNGSVQYVRPPNPLARDYYLSTYSFASKHVSGSWNQTSEVRYAWQVKDLVSGIVVKSGTVWIQHGTQSLLIDDLPAGSYSLEFFDLYKERNKPVSSYNIPTPNPENDASAWASVAQSVPSASLPPSGFVRYTSVGNESQSIAMQVTQTIYNQIDFPDLPGGDQQIVGGLSDLTMMGIAGDITLLRPQDGPDYFIQSHVFVEQGIEVERLLTDDVGASSMYPDLVYYLMQKSQVLQEDQIDKEALRLACKLCQTYGMHFNGVLQTTNSLSEWMTRTSPYFLLTPRQVDGRYGLWPVCPMNAAGELSRDVVQPAMVITADDIAAGSYSRQYISPIDRRPICLVMVYRDQPVEAVGQTVTVEVRYPGTALSGPFESHDLTEHCCRPEQAVYAARYILAKRRFTTHTASFTLGRRAAQLKPGDIVRVDLAVQTTDGEGITDSIFYQLESLAEGQGGQVIVEATHFPVDENGISVVAKETHEGAVTIQ